MADLLKFLLGHWCAQKDIVAPFVNFYQFKQITSDNVFGVSELLSKKSFYKKKVGVNLVKAQFHHMRRCIKEFSCSLKNILKQALTMSPKATRSSFEAVHSSSNIST